jgi:predicted ATPase
MAGESWELALTGKLVSVGTAKDALYSQSQKDSIVFHLTVQQEKHSLFPYVVAFAYPRGTPDVHTLFSDQKIYHLLGGQKISPLRGVNLFGQSITYLNAERLGPRLLYPMTDVWRPEMNVGTRGEYTAHCLAEFGNDPLDHGDSDNVPFGNPDLAYPGESNLLLKYQTELWMRRIIPNLDIDIQSISEADQVRIGLKNQGQATDYLRPTNTGFGISYTLPIIVAALMSSRGSMLIVENPEAHLHPASQSEMGQFLARAAAAGIQVIVETHSDHILNGARLAVKRGLLQAQDVSIQFFTQNVPENKIEVISPQIDADGRIDLWPDGFFDQMEKDLLELY